MIWDIFIKLIGLIAGCTLLIKYFGLIIGATIILLAGISCWIYNSKNNKNNKDKIESIRNRYNQIRDNELSKINKENKILSDYMDSNSDLTSHYIKSNKERHLTRYVKHDLNDLLEKIEELPQCKTNSIKELKNEIKKSISECDSYKESLILYEKKK